jgi:hypothetical protein
MRFDFWISSACFPLSTTVPQNTANTVPSGDVPHLLGWSCALADLISGPTCRSPTDGKSLAEAEAYSLPMLKSAALARGQAVVGRPRPAVVQGYKLCDRPTRRPERSSDFGGCQSARVSLSPQPPSRGTSSRHWKSSEEWPPVRKHETGRGHLRPPPS